MASAWPPKKGVEFVLEFPIRNSSNDLVSGATGLDSEIRKDGGSFADCTNEAAEVGSTGIYELTLTATEMNADRIVVVTKSSGKTVTTVLYTTESTWDEGIDAKAIDAAAIAAIITAMQARTHVGLLQAGSDASSLVLASTASASNDQYNSGLIFVIDPDSPSIAYVAYVTDYDGTTKEAAISPNLPVTPEENWRYVVLAA